MVQAAVYLLLVIFIFLTEAKLHGTTEASKMRNESPPDSHCGLDLVDMTLGSEVKELQRHHEEEQTRDTITVPRFVGESVTFTINTTEHQNTSLVWVMTSDFHNGVITLVTNGTLSPGQTHFGDRLHTDVSAGSITISNLRAEDNGMFIPQILTRTNKTLPKFILNVEDTINVTRLVGQSVTFTINTTEHQNTSLFWVMTSDFHNGVITLITNGTLSPVQTHFGDRLHTDVSAGSIPISNLKAEDNGMFIPQILTGTSKTLPKIMLNVTDILNQSVLEGTNATLVAGKRNGNAPCIIHWTRGDKEKIIACFEDSFTCYPDDDYRDDVMMNPQTADLNFIRASKKHSGLYWVKIRWCDGESLQMRYNMTVYEAVPVPLVTEGRAEPAPPGLCNVSCSVRNGPDVNLTWFEGDQIKNYTSDQKNSSNLSLLLEIRPEREAVYTCKVQNPVSAEQTSVNSSQCCLPADSGFNAGRIYIPVVVVICFVLIVIILGFRYLKRNQAGTPAPPPDYQSMGQTERLQAAEEEDSCEHEERSL